MKPLAVLLCLATLASPAAAETVELMYSGTVASGLDGSGLFGTPGADMAGQSFTATVIYDTSLVPVQDCSGGFGGCQTISGGDLYGSMDPVIQATVSIGGIDYMMDGSAYSYILSVDTSYSGYDQLTVDTAEGFLLDDGTGGGSGSLFIYTLDFTEYLPFGILPEGATVVLPPDNTGGFLYYSTYVYDANGVATVSSSTGLVLSATGLVVRRVEVAAVPLPAGAGMLAAGLGALGLLRRKRKAG